MTVQEPVELAKVPVEQLGAAAALHVNTDDPLNFESDVPLGQVGVGGVTVQVPVELA